MEDTSTVVIDWSRGIIIRDGTEFPFDTTEFWILAPSTSTWDVDDGEILPLEFGFMLHNARIGRGVLPPLATLTAHFTSRSLKSGSPLEAEQLIEKRRREVFPEKPSRLNSYFLNTHRDVAEKRAAMWGWRDRALVRCHLMTTTGSLHCGRVSNYEAVVKNPTSEALADRYWQDSPSIVTEDMRDDVELVADCGLYFPDWTTFDLLDADALVAAQNIYKARWERLGRD
jgi:hypothetical protein